MGHPTSSYQARRLNTLYGELHYQKVRILPRQIPTQSSSA